MFFFFTTRLQLEKVATVYGKIKAVCCKVTTKFNIFGHKAPFLID